jgi:hypothetical protein
VGESGLSGRVPGWEGGKASVGSSGFEPSFIDASLGPGSGRGKARSTSSPTFSLVTGATVDR